MNKYKLTRSSIEELKILDRTEFREPNYWRNENAWCVSKQIGTNADIHYNTYSYVQICFLDEPKEGKDIKIICTSHGDMVKYEFDEFFASRDWKDVASEEFILEIINDLIDRKVIA